MLVYHSDYMHSSSGEPTSPCAGGGMCIQLNITMGNGIPLLDDGWMHGTLPWLYFTVLNYASLYFTMCRCVTAGSTRGSRFHFSPETRSMNTACIHSWAYRCDQSGLSSNVRFRSNSCVTSLHFSSPHIRCVHITFLYVFPEDVLFKPLCVRECGFSCMLFECIRFVAWTVVKVLENQLWDYLGFWYCDTSQTLSIRSIQNNRFQSGLVCHRSLYTDATSPTSGWSAVWRSTAWRTSRM